MNEYFDRFDDVPRRRRVPRTRLRQFRSVPLRVVLPNLVTLGALAMGVTSIRFAAEGNFQTAVVAVIIAAILDGLDGRLARALRGTSRFGAELDSLADFVDFGVAPAMILYFFNLQREPSIGWFAALIFVIGAALRLARFNTMLDAGDRPAWANQFFVGMPAPAGAIVVLLPLYVQLSTLLKPIPRAPVALTVVFVVAIAFLMASRIPHFSGKKIGRIPPEMLGVVLFAIAALLLLLATFPMEVMIVLSLLYLSTVPFAIRTFRRLERRDAERRDSGDARVLRPHAIGSQAAP